jgi:hypothetical protein
MSHAAGTGRLRPASTVGEHGEAGTVSAMSELAPAEHRAMRELFVAARTLEQHWGRLAGHARAPDLLREGAETGRDLLAALKACAARYDLYGTPAAQGAGTGAAVARGLSDSLLERNQALRGALLELRHAEILLGYLGALARTRGDLELAAWHEDWERRLVDLAARGRATLADLAADPEACVAPLDSGWLGRVGQKLNVTLGSLGEAIDTRLGRR